MSTKWLLFARPFFFTVLMPIVAFSTVTTHTVAEARNSTTGDHLALLAIKSMIKGDPQGVLTSWNHSTTTSFCGWQGVTCSARHQRVIHLNLSSGGLIGTLSPSIGNLSFLRGIQLYNNSFSGEIPPEIGRLFRLQELRLFNNSFSGNIPVAIRNCSNLQVLHLGYNNLVGKIPNETDYLSMLNILVLYGNILQGGIPLFIANLTLLDTLSLGHCQLGGSFPDLFHRLTNLRRLALYGNNLTGIIPHSLYNCSLLEQVLLDDNHLFGRLPGNLTSIMPRLVVLLLSDNHIQENILDIPATLELLDLSSNNLWGKLPSLSNGSSLLILELSDNSFMGSLHCLVCSRGVNTIKVLNLGNNHLSGDIPECWEKWSSLYSLILQNNDLSGEFPQTLTVPSLILLNLRGNKFKGNLTNSFWSLPPNLTYLDMSDNQFQGSLTLLGIHETLKVVELSSNEFRGSLHQFLCSNGTKGTNVLNLGNNHLTGVIPECWEKWPSLVFLNMQNNNLYGEIPRTLGSISPLQLLSMRGNMISGRLPSSLMNLSHLKILQLSWNELTESIPTWIGTKLNSLRILNLRSNKFYGSIPHELCYLTHTQILDLAHNNLSGYIPRCFNNFSILSGIQTNSKVQISISYGGWSSIVGDSLVIKGREDTYKVFLGLVMLLDLSSNNFIGKIPSELTALRELKSLNLSRNQLIGNIPDKIGDIEALESLDLSVNKLSGELPLSLSKLNLISSFNVSYNNLTGRIPISTQIQSLNESNFFGNKLCGAPLNSDCVRDDVLDAGDQKEDDGAHDKSWGLIISIVLGFIVGFWSIVGSLIVNGSWRIAYFRFLSKFIKVYGL